MKGIIPVCLKEMVTERFGLDKWEATLIEAGESQDISFLATEDCDDLYVLKLFMAACRAINISIERLYDSFGDYWINVFSQRVYGSYFRRYKSAADFITGMDSLHPGATRNIKNAAPPRFDYLWKDSQTLIVAYT